MLSIVVMGELFRTQPPNEVESLTFQDAFVLIEHKLKQNTATPGYFYGVILSRLNQSLGCHRNVKNGYITFRL
jgi:hypothetical protein